MARIARWIARLWRRRLRSIDLQVLWPECVRQAPSIEMARVAFAMHAFHDSAWMADYSEEELEIFIDRLER